MASSPNPVSHVSPARSVGEGDRIHPAVLAHEMVAEHLRHMTSEKDAEAKKNRQIAELLALELKVKAEDAAYLEARAAGLENLLQTESAQASRLPMLMNEVTQLMQELQEHREKAVGLTDEVERLHAVIRYLESEVAEKGREAAENHRAHQDALRQQEGLQNRLASLTAKNQEYEEMLHRQNEAYHKLQSLSHQVANQNQVLNNEAERLGRLVPDLQQQCAVLREQLQSTEGLQAEADRLSHMVEITDELRAAASQVPQLQSEKVMLAQACEQMSNEIPALNLKIVQLTKQCNSMQEMKVELERWKEKADEVPSLKHELLRLQEVTRAQNLAVQTAKEEAAALRRETQRIPELKEEIHRLGKIAEKVPAQNALREGLCHSLDEKEKQVAHCEKALARHIEMHNTVVGNLRARIAELETTIKEKAVQHNQALDDIKEPFIREIEGLQRRLAQKEDDEAVLRTKYLEQQRRLADTMEMENTALRKQLKSSEEKVAELHEQLKNVTHQEHVAAREEAAMLKRLLETNKKLLQQSQADAIEMRERKDAIIKQLRHELGQANEKLTRSEIAQQVTKEHLETQRDDVLTQEVKKLRDELSEVRGQLRAGHRTRSVSPMPSLQRSPVKAVARSPSAMTRSPSAASSFSPYDYHLSDSPRIAPPRYRPT